MLKMAVTTDDGKTIVLLGLTFGNLDYLREDKPILLKVEDCQQLGLGENLELFIYSGEDEISMTRELEARNLLPPGSTAKVEQAQAQHGTVQLNPEQP